MTPQLRAEIEAGAVDTATHIEQMAIRMSRLMATVEPELALQAVQMDDLPFIARMRFGGALLYSQYGAGAFVTGPRSNAPDLFRGWQAFAIADAPFDVDAAFSFAIPFAIDDHFAVREWAWLAVRPRVIAHPEAAMAAARRITNPGGVDPRLVRFAVEVTRPRSVWGGHVERFKSAPELGEEVLRCALNQTDRYPVRAALNWISDAARTRPAWSVKFAQVMAAEVTNGWTVNQLRNWV
ncbi:DNA alkylation repair protein [soil metagenome]